jgi:hypothetical protein
VLDAAQPGTAVCSFATPGTDSQGRRRAPFWLRGWWRGEQAQNRDDRWT